MTPDYAIEKIQEFIDCDGTQMIDIVTLITAQDALRKQIPQKPNTYRFPSGIKKAVCPRCLMVEDESAKYCRSCGQALDWEDDNDT